MPSVIPKGLLCPPFPATDEERTIGNNGHIQGARMVTRPDRKAKIRSTDTTLVYNFYE